MSDIYRPPARPPTNQPINMALVKALMQRGGYRDIASLNAALDSYRAMGIAPNDALQQMIDFSDRRTGVSQGDTSNRPETGIGPNPYFPAPKMAGGQPPVYPGPHAGVSPNNWAGTGMGANIQSNIDAQAQHAQQMANSYYDTSSQKGGVGSSNLPYATTIDPALAEADYRNAWMQQQQANRGYDIRPPTWGERAWDATKQGASDFWRFATGEAEYERIATMNEMELAQALGIPAQQWAFWKANVERTGQDPIEYARGAVRQNFTQERQNKWQDNINTGVGIFQDWQHNRQQPEEAPEAASLRQRQAELSQHQAEQRADLARAETIYNRPEQVQAAQDIAMAQQSAGTRARQELGGAAGSGAAAVAGSAAAYQAGEQMAPQALQSARQLRYQYEQQMPQRRQAAAETGADINVAEQQRIAMQRKYTDMLNRNREARRIQSNAAAANARANTQEGAMGNAQAFAQGTRATTLVPEGSQPPQTPGAGTERPVAPNNTQVQAQQPAQQPQAGTFTAENLPPAGVKAASLITASQFAPTRFTPEETAELGADKIQLINELTDNWNLAPQEYREAQGHRKFVADVLNGTLTSWSQ